VSHSFLAKIDSVRARARFAINIQAVLPHLINVQEVDWQKAVHPILLLSFRELGKEKDVIPLDIKLQNEERILLISGPNAGGKSVCLQTIGLLQYMLQCGFLVPMSETSVCGCFKSIFLDMGDEQSIEDDLSTYSSHLLNMKFFVRNAGKESLILIDEFGSGTEPMLGGAIAEAVLESLNESGVFGVITTHYTNLKHYASSAKGIVNGAMLFDTGKLQPLFKLAAGRPGSSFAFEIARKIGLPENILQKAKDKIGQEHVDFEKHLKDLIRDKKYWEDKRQSIRISDKKLAQLVDKYDVELRDTEKLRKKILKEAKDQADILISEANRRIENTIREIRESDAEKSKTKEARKKLEEFKIEIDTTEQKGFLDSPSADDLKEKLKEVSRHNEQLKQRDPAFRQKQKKEKVDPLIHKGNFVLMKGQDTPGEVLELKGNKATVAFGEIRTVVNLNVLEKISEEKYKSGTRPKTSSPAQNQWSIGKKRLTFSPDIDVRG
jgi:DNA mismatch repair protein MutS2